MNPKTSFFMALVAFAMSLATTTVFLLHLNDSPERDRNISEVRTEVFTKDAGVVECQVLYKVSKKDLKWFEETGMYVDNIIRIQLNRYIGDFKYEEFCDETVKQAHKKVIYEQLRLAFAFSDRITIEHIAMKANHGIVDNFIKGL
jgi:hypothetical protein